MKSKMVLVIVGFMVMGICAANVLPVSQVQSPVSPAASSKPVVSPVSPASPTAEIVDPETPSLVE